MLLLTYYAQNYASIISARLLEDVAQKRNGMGSRKQKTGTGTTNRKLINVIMLICR